MSLDEYNILRSRAQATEFRFLYIRICKRVVAAYLRQYSDICIEQQKVSTGIDFNPIKAFMRQILMEV
jgi:hypothetical protein